VAKQNSLGSALLIILGSCFFAMLIMVISSIITGDLLYLLAGALFLASGIVSVVVIRNLQRKIDGPTS